jgi:hypothetical protein
VSFVGEAEYTWPQLRDHAAGRWSSEYRQGDKPSMLDLPLPRFDLLKVDHYCSMAISLEGYFGWRVSGFLCSAMVWFQRSRRSTASEFTGSVR